MPAGGWAGNLRLLSASILASVAESGKISSVHGKYCGMCLSFLGIFFWVCLSSLCHLCLDDMVTYHLHMILNTPVIACQKCV